MCGESRTRDGCETCGEIATRRFRYVCLTAALMVLLTLTGCGGAPSFTLNPQDLYALPRLPAKYTELSGLLNGILSAGAEYAAPASGSNIQSVQMTDLDGDGREEAVAYLRNPGDDKPLKLYIFTATADGDAYRLLRTIEGAGTSIYSVAYSDMDSDGKLEIAVGWKAAAELQVLEIYSLNREKPLITTDYVKYIIADLNQDDRMELVALRSGEDGESTAEYYAWQDNGALASHSRAPLSVTMAELAQQGRVRAGVLRNGKPALFVTGVTVQNSAVTDVLALRGGEFANLVLDQSTGVSRDITPFYSLYPVDMNSDGITEVPRPIPISIPMDESDPIRNSETVQHVIEWRQYDLSGATATVMRTYHNLEDGWYLRLPESWRDRFLVERTTGTGEASVTFLLRKDNRPFLRISAFTGSGREVRSVRGERFALNRQPETIYAGELLEAADAFDPPLTEADVRSAFSLILREWLSGDN